MRTGVTTRGTRIVQRMATDQMMQTCVIERVVAPSYDPSTLVASPGSRTTIYTGPCRIWEQQNPSMVQISETDFLAYQTVLSLPWATDPVPHLLDEAQILTSPTDSVWVGARFRIQTHMQGGNIRATRSFVVERLEVRP